MHECTRGTNRCAKSRRLLLELLEERRVLSAASLAAGLFDATPAATTELPWQNALHHPDVTDDGITTTSDLLAVVNRILRDGQGDLPEPTSTPTLFVDTNGDNRLTTSDMLVIINALLKQPVVETSMLTSFTIDVTPQVTVTATEPSGAQLPDGTKVLLDVDVNNDGTFSPDELARTESTLYHGKAEFSITPALERKSELYTVQVRARVQNEDAVFGTSKAIPLVVDTLTSNVLADYVNTPDDSYDYAIRKTETKSIPLVGSYTYIAIDLTSQTWRSSADVDKPVWRHWLTMYVPTGTTSSSAVLLIDGGSNTHFDTAPDAIDLLGQAAVLLGSAFVHLSVVPNEPVTFTDESSSRTEDEIIAYSFDQFLDHLNEPGNETWPVLLPMVKSAVRAMDTVQTELPSISDFIVTGYSKRGWTTWLTAAVDDRVRAIMPGVFDNLNQGPQMVHHYGAYGFFSQAVQPYNDMQIFDRILTPEGLELSRITDPYRYLANGRFDDMPKLLINSAGDEFFNSDSAQFYFDDIPGQQNYLLYLPNTGHGLDIDLEGSPGQTSQVASSTITFADALLHNHTLPKYSWTVGQDGAIRAVTDTTPIEVRLWQADNPDARDFRNRFNPDITWTSTVLSPTEPGVYVGDVAIPDTGARAYFVQFVFPNSNHNFPVAIPYLSDPYVFTTEIRVKTNLPLFDWPYESAFDVGALVATESTVLGAPVVDKTLNATATALAIEQESFGPSADNAVDLPLTPAAKPLAQLPISTAPSLLMSDVEMDPLMTSSSEFATESDSLVDDELLELLA